MKQFCIGQEWRLAIPFLAFFFWVLPASADQTEKEPELKVSVPGGSGLIYSRKPENPNFVVFDGEVKLDGLLLAYWELQYPDEGVESLAASEPVRQLMFRFYPAPLHTDRLPALSARGSFIAAPPERIFIYKSRSEDAFIDHFESAYASDEEAQGLLQVFDALPAGFLETREGKAVQPVSLTLSGLAAFIEGGYTFTFGQVGSVSTLSMTDYSMSVIPDAQPDSYFGQPWIYRLMAPDATKLYSEPEGDVLVELPAGTSSLSRLAPVEDGWVKVLFQDPESGEATVGYLNAQSILPAN